MNIIATSGKFNITDTGLCFDLLKIDGTDNIELCDIHEDMYEIYDLHSYYNICCIKCMSYLYEHRPKLPEDLINLIKQSDINCYFAYVLLLEKYINKLQNTDVNILHKQLKEKDLD